jgi:hypothetical protein
MKTMSRVFQRPRLAQLKALSVAHAARAWYFRPSIRGWKHRILSEYFFQGVAQSK